jgi:hypothetical protein
MAIVVRPAGYTGSLQRIIWNQGNAVSATAYLWGGGGGAGGADSASGGDGGGAGFSVVNFTVNEGDTIEVAVGGGGGGGQSSAGDAAGGSAGASYVADYLFNTRDAVTSPAVFPQFNSAWCTFLNTFGVWVNPTSAAVFDRTYTVNFPTTGNYQFTCCADNSARFFIDDVEAFYADNFTAPWTVGYSVTAGNHSLRILGTNTGGPGAVALTIGGGVSYSGGRGGNSGPAGSSGAGGGGGGATVLILNSGVIGLAGGGGAGGGGGNSGAATGGTAPGPNGQASPGENAGQNGTNKAQDGGGGGGGGGGYAGGNGGTTPGGDQGGYAGYYGSSQGNTTANPSGRTPGGTSNQYWSGAGRGGASNSGLGTTGYAMLEFDVSGIFVHNGGSFTPVNETYIKANGQWNSISSIYIKQGGVWIPVNGSIAPAFENVANSFGVNPRSGVQETQSGEVTDPGGTGGGTDGGGGGGGCFLAGTQIIMIDGTLKSIEDIVAGDIILEALSNNPARVIGIKTRAHDVDKWVFSLSQDTDPYITEEHPWYDDTNQLCAISDLAATLAPWLSPIKIVDVANKKKITEAVTVYNLMLETGESHYANGVRVNNIVKTGGSYILVQKGFLDQVTYENYVHNLENQNVSPAQQILIFNYMLKLTNYILQNNNVCSKILGKSLAWALKNRDSVYPYLNRWFKSRLRRWIFRKNI